MAVKSPKEVIEATIVVAEHKVALSSRNYKHLLVLSALAGAYIALGGILSFIVGYGFPGITAENPSLQRLLSGCMFPIGLCLVVVLGAELFTGNNAVLIPAYMQRRISFGSVLKNWALVYLGNFIGAIAVAYLLVDCCSLTASEPYRSAIIGIAEAKVSMPWIVVMLKGVGANWCVCLAVWLAMSGSDLVSKLLGCWLPVMAFVVLGYEHSIANMFFIPTGMMAGADVTIGQMILNNMIPATIGNIIGGALLVGCAYGYVNLQKNNDSK